MQAANSAADICSKILSGYTGVPEGTGQAQKDGIHEEELRPVTAAKRANRAARATLIQYIVFSLLQ